MFKVQSALERSNSFDIAILNEKSYEKSEPVMRLKMTKKYMLENLHCELTLDELSKQACMCVNHFLRTFKQEFKCTPHQYLTRARLNRASYLLKNTDYSVNEIADLIGFVCVSTFIMLFKKNYLLTPGKFRLAHRYYSD